MIPKLAKYKYVSITTLLITFLIVGCSAKKKFEYDSKLLVMDSHSVKDSLRQISISELSSKAPIKEIRLQKALPFTDTLWNVALSDIESNIVETPEGKYFGAGKHFGVSVYTRDISFSGILGLNELYPEIMLNSLKMTRKLRLELGFHVSKDNAIPEIQANWKEDTLNEHLFLQKYHTNSYTRRTDDVVWMWAAKDLFNKNPGIADWKWLYDNGKKCFNQLYKPFYDPADGLYRGQAAFIDIHFINKKTTGYPQEFSMSDCVLIKPLSTNCLYYEGLKTMEYVCHKIGKKKEEENWKNKAESLKFAIRNNLQFKDGTFSYFKNTDGKLEPRRDALGSALVVITGIVKEDDAKKCISDYPVSWAGAPLFNPFYPGKRSYHNNTAWPFVDTFVLWAKEIAENKSYIDQNAALLARTCVKDGTFHEVVNYISKEPKGSGSQLWTAAAFVNVCIRAGLYP